MRFELKLAVFALCCQCVVGCMDTKMEYRAPEDETPSDHEPPSTTPPSETPEEKTALDIALGERIASHGLHGKPGADIPVETPDDSSLVHLGQLLFFSHAMSLDYQAACASCHHPALGSGDGLSLPIGTASVVKSVLGLERVMGVDPGPFADGGPDVPRNSQPIFNSGLYEQAMFWDGRVYVVGETDDGELDIRTPDSGKRADLEAGGNLLQAQSRFPINSPDEMRGYQHPNLHTGGAVRDFLQARFQGVEDENVGYDPHQDPAMTEEMRANWLTLFQKAFGEGSVTDVVTFRHIQEAIGAYETSQIYVDSPWNAYVQGNMQAIGDEAKNGAVLFFDAIEDGGLGCASCHTGDRFTDEQFHNVGFPQFGHGKRDDRSDLGRYSVVQEEENLYAFRTPSLLNVMDTAPWGHTGAFDSMEALLQYHADPIEGAKRYTLSNILGLSQFMKQGLPSTAQVNHQDVQRRSLAVLAASSFGERAQDRLVNRALKADEVRDLVAFLSSLSDPAVSRYNDYQDCESTSRSACPDVWIPKSTDPHVDAHTLFASFDGDAQEDQTDPEASGDIWGSGGVAYPSSIALNLPENVGNSTFADTFSCDVTSSPAIANTGALAFEEHADTLGLSSAIHGYLETTWFLDYTQWVETLMQMGAISAVYLNDDCWPDLVFSGGDDSGLKTYINRGDGSGFDDEEWIDTTGISGARVSEILSVDLNGDYRRELVLGNALPGATSVFGWDDLMQRYKLHSTMPMGRNTYSISAGDINGDGFPDLYLAHWGPGGLPGSAPALFINDGQDMAPGDGLWGVGTADGMSQVLNFTPAFGDLNGDGRQDLLVASDFWTSWASHNDGQKFIFDDPEHTMLIDANGMGQALADFDNDGLLDWFVTAIFDGRDHRPDAPWGTIGNVLYRNATTQQSNAPIDFVDVTEQAGVADAGWAWGTCAADFNNDGWLDLFVENGMGYLPEDRSLDYRETREGYDRRAEPFKTTKPRLFINNGDGTFTDRSDEMAFLESNGRGVVCFDYDHDGDIDIVVHDNSSSLLFYVNKIGSGISQRFVNIRLVGQAPNTDALGARVRVRADLQNDAQEVVQTREVNMNSNFVSHNLTNLHFGVGRAEHVTIEIQWPDGRMESHANVPVNQYLIYHE